MTPAQLSSAHPGWTIFRSRGAAGDPAAWYATRDQRLSDAELYRGAAATLAADTPEELHALLVAQHDAGPLSPSDQELFAAVELPGTKAAVPMLRRWVRALCSGSSRRAGDLELIASEYATNALWHSASGLPGGRLRAEIQHSADNVRLTVYDGGPIGVSQTWPDEQLDEHGRGLMLVAAYADDYGDRRLPDGRHVAWALLNR
ncbi:ATP-binding protein [Actinomadura hibisca]|uniref:ATP-binding protein n=1 Tax=Actinomadura hibisca TaxID=68565 RepID=UPI00082D6A6E|nr:ATP-binding protein [Actinomadura hibisca]